MKSSVLKLILLLIAINYWTPINSRTAANILERVVDTYSQMTTYGDESIYTINIEMENSTIFFKIDLERNGDLSLELEHPNRFSWEYSFIKKKDEIVWGHFPGCMKNFQKRY